jgi:8-amino-7-oxononanoate synthase
VLDFTSALYLGFEHAWRDLPEWARLTLGKPAALEDPPLTVDVQSELAELIGCRRAVLAPSTLHAFWDLFEILARRGMSALVDEGSYPIAKWGIDRAAARGMPVCSFRAGDWRGLAYRAQQMHRPVVVTDGYVPGIARTAPLARYLDFVKARGGLVVVDDTQALGILGRSPGQGAPYGRGGGGSLRRFGVEDDRVVVVSSLAKAFGVPVAVLAGPEELVAGFERESATRVHCSRHRRR